MQKKLYQITDKVNSQKIAEFLSKDGWLLLPFLDLICNTEQAVDELIDVVGKAAIESVGGFNPHSATESNPVFYQLNISLLVSDIN